MARSEGGLESCAKINGEVKVMQANIQEIYANTIRPLTDDEKLRIATLVLEEVTSKSPATGTSPTPQRTGGIAELFGSWQGGDPNGSDNERIDADLAREYASSHEDED